MKKLTKLLALTMTGGLLLAACGDAYNDDNDLDDNDMEIYEDNDLDDDEYENDDMDEE